MHIAAHPYLCVFSPLLTMPDSSWEFLAIKLITVPIFIWVISTVARKWGHSVGGIILGLPLTSGPVLFFLALEQGNAFASKTALGTLMGMIPLAASCLVFSLISFRTNWPACLITSFSTFFVLTFILNYVSLPPLELLVAVLTFLAITRNLFPIGSVGKISHKPPVWEIPARAISATALVLLITGGATMLGPHLSGLLTPFPIYATILGVFTLKFEGASASALFLRGVITGCMTTAIFQFMISTFITQLGAVYVMAYAGLVVLLTHSLLLYVFGRDRHHKSR